MSLNNCIKKLGKALNKTDADAIRSIYAQLVKSGMDDASASAKAVDDVISEVASEMDNMLVKSGAKKVKRARGLRAPFKARKFLIPDEMVEEFLERDIEELAHVYLRHTVPDMEMVRAFGDNKTPIDDVLELKIQEKEIMEDYSNLANAAKTEKERNKIIKEGQDVIAALAGMRDRIRGVYDIPEGAPSLGRRINTAFRNLNYVRLMGGVLASSIPDIGKQVMSEGFMRAFGDGFAPLVRNISSMKPIKAEMRHMGLGLETITAGRVESLADINNYALGNTKIERALEGLASRFGNIALINQWNDAMKTSHALAMQARVYDDLMKGVFDERLSRLGITEDEAQGIAEMLKKHSTKQGGARLFNTKNWERQNLAFAWAAAVRKESDRVVIVPGQEKPLFMSRDVGKTLLQFRSFMLSSTQRTLLSAAQGQEANVLGGMLTMITLGAMVYAFKQWDAGREISDDPKVWISEGIDRSGALGIIMEASNTVEKISGNRFGLRSALGVSEPASRFASRSQYEALLGPTYGSAFPGILRLATAGLDEHEWKESDTSAVRRMVPFQNLTFLRQAIDAAEQKIHEGIAQ